MHGAVVLDLHPRLGHLVEPIERQLGDAVEHRHEPSLECAPERLLLAVLVGAVGQRPLVDDAQAQQPFGDFLGHHGRAVIGQESPRQPAFLDRLGESVDQVLGGLTEVPLDVAAEPRVVIEDAQRDRVQPGPGVREHLERAVVEVEVPQRPDVLGLVAANLASLASGFGDRLARVPGGLGLGFAHPAVSLHVALDRGIGTEPPSDGSAFTKAARLS